MVQSSFPSLFFCPILGCFVSPVLIFQAPQFPRLPIQLSRSILSLIETIYPRLRSKDCLLLIFRPSSGENMPRKCLLSYANNSMENEDWRTSVKAPRMLSS